MNGTSPWAVSAQQLFDEEHYTLLFQKEYKGFSVEVCHENTNLWLLAGFSKKGQFAFRLAYSVSADLVLTNKVEKDNRITFFLTAAMGEYHVTLELPQDEESVLHYTTTIIPPTPLLIPFWPKEILMLGKKGSATRSSGKVHLQQTGLRTGMIYLSMTEPQTGSMLYLQNLTALNDYCQETETSCTDTVGGEWPELGFSIPPNMQKPLPAGKKITIADAFVVFDEIIPADESDLSKQFLNLLADTYVCLPKPETTYHNWLDIADKSLNDLKTNRGCWSQVNGRSYLNAYVCDYSTPPESMVQLAVLLPLLDYQQWSKKDLDVIHEVRNALPQFYDKKINSVARWLPAVEAKLDRSEEHKHPRVMDSWYLHHPMLNLSRMALDGDRLAKKLFFNSLEYVIKVARHFNYRWPVFYNVDTLEVIKAETAPGKGGEHDVAGTYAHVLLQAWELTGEKRYFQEAEKAAKSLQGMGLDLFYQANNTAFAAGALLRLWKETRDELYLNLSYLCLANIFKNVWLWECQYGYAKHYPTFFALFPLSDAPYAAVYEEQEGFSAFHDYLTQAEGEDILPSASLLLAEFIRFAVHRLAYYYPPMLPKEMIAQKTKMGEIDPNLWIALEDLNDGWKESGTVGQEVYGAGTPFSIIPRHYLKARGGVFTVFVDYPTTGYRRTNGSLSFSVKGDNQLYCRMLLFYDKNKALPLINVEGSRQKKIIGKNSTTGYIEYRVQGNQRISIKHIHNIKKQTQGVLVRN